MQSDLRADPDLEFVNPPALGDPVGLYSHLAIDRRRGLAFIAGQLAVRESMEEEAPADFGGQLELVLENLSKAAEPIGGLSRIVQMTTYLIDADDISEFYEHRARLFPQYFGEPPYPPNTLLIVQRLVGAQYRLEIQAVASVK